MKSAVNRSLFPKDLKHRQKYIVSEISSNASTTIKGKLGDHT